jgi:hypothetical protein
VREAKYTTNKAIMKIYLNKPNESWVVDRFVKEWYEHNPDISTKNIKESDMIWLIAPWTWKKISKRQLKQKKVICTIHHIDIDKFDKNEEKNFYNRDRFVDEYHSISQNTTNQLNKLTTKKITTIPFWINQDIFFSIEDKQTLKKKYEVHPDSFLIGSFQRDTEGEDLISPKLSKGPDQFLEIVNYYHSINKNLTVLLTGKRRNYLLKKLNELNIEAKYFEMINFAELNELYNILDLYVVASRVEGGPQAIFECGLTKTPIISTDVGIASEILHKKSIFAMSNYKNAQPDVETAFTNSIEYIIPDGFNLFMELFGRNNEN